MVAASVHTGPCNRSVQPVRATGPCNRSVQPVRATGPCNRSVQPVRATGPCNRSVQPVRATGPCNRSVQPVREYLSCRNFIYVRLYNLVQNLLIPAHHALSYNADLKPDFPDKAFGSAIFQTN